MRSPNKEKNTSLTWLKELEGKSTKEFAEALAKEKEWRYMRDNKICNPYHDDSDNVASEADYVMQALCCNDIRSLDVEKLIAAKQYLLVNRLPVSVINTIEIMIAYHQFLSKKISEHVFIELLANATNKPKHQANMAGIHRGYRDRTLSPDDYLEALSKAKPVEDCGIILLPKASLPICHFSAASSGPINFSYANLKGADLRGSDFSHCKLDHANLDDTILQGAKFRHCSMKETQLRDAFLLDIDFSATELKNIQLLTCDHKFKYTDQLSEKVRIWSMAKIPDKIIFENLRQNIHSTVYGYSDSTRKHKISLWKAALKHPAFEKKGGIFSKASPCIAAIKAEIQGLKMDEEKIAEQLEIARYKATDPRVSSSMDMEEYVDKRNRYKSRKH